jgi:putative addiction module killer protein
MKNLIRTEGFSAWLGKLKDRTAVAKIAIRIDRLGLGNPGDVKPVGGGVSEMRIDYGPGYRVYFAERKGAVIILLRGGTKKTQQEDIRETKRLDNEWKKNDQDTTL